MKSTDTEATGYSVHGRKFGSLGVARASAQRTADRTRRAVIVWARFDDDSVLVWQLVMPRE